MLGESSGVLVLESEEHAKARCTRDCTLKCTHACTLECTRTHTQKRARAHTHIPNTTLSVCTGARMCTHTRTHTRNSHAHIQTHTLPIPPDPTARAERSWLVCRGARIYCELAAVGLAFGVDRGEEVPDPSSWIASTPNSSDCIRCRDLERAHVMPRLEHRRANKKGLCSSSVGELTRGTRRLGHGFEPDAHLGCGLQRNHKRAQGALFAMDMFPAPSPAARERKRQNTLQKRVCAASTTSTQKAVGTATHKSRSVFLCVFLTKSRVGFSGTGCGREEGGRGLPDGDSAGRQAERQVGVRGHQEGLWRPHQERPVRGMRERKGEAV